MPAPAASESEDSISGLGGCRLAGSRQLGFNLLSQGLLIAYGLVVGVGGRLHRHLGHGFRRTRLLTLPQVIRTQANNGSGTDTHKKRFCIHDFSKHVVMISESSYLNPRK